MNKITFPFSFAALAFFTVNAYSQVPGSDLPTYDSTGHYSCKGADRVELCVGFFNHITLGSDAGGGLVWTHDGQGWLKSPNPAHDNVSIPTLRTHDGNECPTSFNPYTNPECAVRARDTVQGLKDNGWRFEIGKTYVHPYTALNVTVIGLLVNVHGVSVFVAETAQEELRQFPIGANPQLFAFYKVQ